MDNNKNIYSPQVDINTTQVPCFSEELQQIKNISSLTKRTFDESIGIFSIFFKTALKHSDNIAIIDDESNVKLSYRQLYNLVRHLEVEMIKNGITQGTKVGINLNRTYKVIALVLCLCKIGAVIVPLDKTYPENYILHIVSDCNLKFIVSEEKNIHEKDINIISIDDFDKVDIDFFEIESKNESQNLREIRNQIDELRFIYYTSGSTGKPKGAKHTEKHFLYEFFWRSENLPLNNFDVVGQRAPINVVLSLIDMFHGILSGVKTVLIPNHVLTDLEKLSEKIKLYKISFMILPSSLLALLSLIGNEYLNNLNSLKTIITGGEVLKKSTFTLFKSKFPHVKIVDFYGCTEMLLILFKKMDIIEDFDNDFNKVYNLSVYILDDNNNILPCNKIGEICVTGLFTENSGYYSLENLNTEKFFEFKNPLTGKIEKVYRTGDFGYITSNGKYHILGRKDSVVKINARSVNLKGIESAISDMPLVKSVVVVFKKMSNKQDCGLLCAMIVPNSPLLDKSKVLEFLKESLPDYMIPKNISFLEDLPKLPNGKIDYKILENEIIDKSSNTSLRTTVFEILSSFVGELSEKDGNIEFSTLGLDSLSSTKFIFELSKKIGVHISPSEIYNYPTPNKLIDYISNLKKEVPKNLKKDINKTSSGIAVVGMSCKFPDANNINEFWENLCNSHDSIKEIPPTRWDISDFYDPVQGKEGYSYSKWGGFLKNIDLFDAQFFDISEKEALAMDPQQRICLEESYNALIDAGWDNTQTKNVGVFIGASNFDYKEKIDKENLINSETILGNEPSILASRISYFNDFYGPCLTINTACSSSLVAVHLACQSLLANECDIAVVGGINIINSPDFYKNTSALGIFSPSGKCRTFDNYADGFVPGEGAGFLVLKRLTDTLDTDKIYSIIKGTAINQDGETNGITAPNGNSQFNLHCNLYRKTGINPNEISYLETHGTGTKLGDLIELEAIERVFKEYSLKYKCEIGSVKTNIGHLIAAAGIAGLIKTILCIYNRTLVPSLNFSVPNKLFDWSNSHLKVTTTKKSWNEEKLIAGVSSYGIGGTNAFCIIQESPNSKLNDKKETIYYKFNEKSFYLSEKNEINSDKQLNDNFESILKENFNSYQINDELTLIENGVDSLKLIDFKNYLSKKNILIALDDLMNKSVKSLKESVTSENNEELHDFCNDNSFLSEDFEKLSDDELRNLLDRFS